MLKGRAAPRIAGTSGEEIRVGTRLGWLYLDQGHLADAAAVFQAVLRDRPEDTSAREGLATVLERRRQESTGAEGAPTSAAVSLRERRIAALRDYLARIRRA